MGEAEKIDTLSAPETPADNQPESTNEPAEIFDRLQALIGRDGFNLRGKINKSKKINEKVRQEMVGYIDEAMGLVSSYKFGDSRPNLAKEAAEYFDVLQAMAEKHIPGFEKKLAKYNGKIEAKKAMAAENQSEVKYAAGELSKEDSGKDKNKITLVKLADDAVAAQDSLTADGGEKETGLEANKEDETNSSMAEKDTLIAGVRINSDPDKPSADKQRPKSKESHLKVGGTLAEQLKNKADKIQAAVVSEKDDKKSVKEKGGGKEPPGGENEEEIKKQLDAAYKKLYGFLNKKEDAPPKIYKELTRLNKELQSVLKDRSKVGEIAEDLKKRYRQNDKANEEIDKKEKKQEKKTPEKAKEKKELEKKESAELEIPEDLIARRAAEIKLRRERGEKGFEWEKIRELIFRQGFVPDTDDAAKFMAKWDRNAAESELRKELRKKGKDSSVSVKPARSGKTIKPSVLEKENVFVQRDQVREMAEWSKARQKELAERQAQDEKTRVESAKKQKKSGPAEKRVASGPSGQKELIDEQGEKVDKELSSEKREVFEQVGREFYNALREGASWGGYDKENMRTTLEIQTKVFLKKQMSKFNLIAEDKIDGAAEMMVKNISG